MRHQDQWNKQGEHEITGDGSCQIEAFKLPCTNQDRERRNFQGYTSSVPGADLMDAISCEGTTETRGGKSMNHAYDPAKSPTIRLRRRYG